MRRLLGYINVKVISSGAWSIFGTVSEKAFTVLTYILVSRSVDIGSFGNMVTVLLTFELFSYVSSFGVRENIIRNKQCNINFLTNCFYFILGISASLFLLTVFVVAPLAEILANEMLSELFLYMSLYPSVICINTFYQGILQRSMQFKSLAIRRVFTSLASGIVGIYAAANGHGIYSIVYAKYSYVILDFLILRYLAPFELEGKISYLQQRDIYSFGWKLSLSQIMNFFSSKSTEVFSLLFLGPASLAILDVGRKFLVTLYSVMMSAITPVSLSAMSNSSDALTTYHKIVRLLVIVLVPPVAIMGTYSSELIEAVFGDKWRDSSTILTILSFTVISQSITWHLQNLCIHSGRPSLLIRLHGINLLTISIFLAASMVVNKSLLTLAIAYVSAMALSGMLRVTYVCTSLNISALPFIKHLIEALALFMVCFYIIGSIPIPSPYEILDYSQDKYPQILSTTFIFIVSYLLITPYIVTRIIYIYRQLNKQ